MILINSVSVLFVELVWPSAVILADGKGYDFTPLKLADDVTITSKCTILADLGERAVIGANSVVSKPIPAFSVAVGAPAKVIDYFGPESS